MGDSAVFKPARPGAGTRGVQPKLTVGRADDIYEREADHVAARVVRGLRAADDQAGSPPRQARDTITNAGRAA